ncbi:MAG: hypothetical protein AAFQ43_09100, partial [Bacteroidota bacterium]
MPAPWSRRSAHQAPAYVDTPVGLLGRGGTHFHTTEALVEEFAGPLLEKEPLATYVDRAEAWLEAPRALAVTLLPVWLALMPWPLAVVATFATFGLWALASPALASRAAVAVVRVLAHPITQAAILIVALSLLAREGQVGAVWAGLVTFVVFRIGLVERLLGPLVAKSQARLYPLPVPDQVLRAFLTRGAIRHGVSLPGLGEIG